MKAVLSAAAEGARYFIAAATALAIDFGVYVGPIRLAGVHYLLAAPAGFAFGLAVIYTLSIRWVFVERRLKDARSEFAIFCGHRHCRDAPERNRDLRGCGGLVPLL